MTTRLTYKNIYKLLFKNIVCRGKIYVIISINVNMPESNEESAYRVMKLISDIKNGTIINSYEIAIKTVELLQHIVANEGWITAHDLMELIRSQGQKLQSALPQQATSTNVLRHVLKIIREEYIVACKNKSEGLQSLHQIVTAGDDIETEDYKKSLPSLCSSILEHLGEFQTELETSSDNIAAQASDHIHSNEIIMTLGKSTLVERFLKSAAKNRKFHVIVAECAPACKGHTFAANLAKSKIQTTVIADTAVFAMMSRVNKVIIGTHTVMANGGLRAVSGAHTVALAAKHYSVPVLVLTAMYKLSPVFLCSYEQDAFNVYGSPGDVIPYATGSLQSEVRVYNPIFDYVPPDLVTLYISNQGGNAPSYIYRLLTELYDPRDYNL